MKAERQTLRWGIIGPGRIAGHFADAIERHPGSRLVAIGTRDPSRPGLRDRFGVARIHRGYEALLEDDEVDVVYIATPHSHHAEWGVRAAAAGRHVLCEKPIALDARQAGRMFDAARDAGTFMGEAFMYRFHPLTARLLEILNGGVIGRPLFVQSSFAFANPRDEANRRLVDPALAGGGIYDLGVYPVSMARLIAGVAVSADFADPAETAGVAHIGETGVDEWAAAVLRFPDGLVAEVSCGISIRLDNMLRIYGSGGRLEVSEFWFGSGFHGGTGYIGIHPDRGEPRSVAVETSVGPYDFEVAATADAIGRGQKEFSAPGMSRADTLGNMRTIDTWRASIGLDGRRPAP
jgi:predicted dehydrogenase